MPEERAGLVDVGAIGRVLHAELAINAADNDGGHGALSRSPTIPLLLLFETFYLPTLRPSSD